MNDNRCHHSLFGCHTTVGDVAPGFKERNLKNYYIRNKNLQTEKERKNTTV
jgi:hypothetical protein